MPCLIRHIPIAPRPDTDGVAGPAGGEPLPPDRWAADLVEAAAFEREPGVYGMFGTWNGRRVVCLSRHLDRLEDSARRAGFPLVLDRDHLRAELSRLLDDAGFREARIRVSAAPGADTLIISAEPYAGPPMDLRITGVGCATVSKVARTNPRAKQTSWLRRRSEITADSPDAFEYLLLDGAGRILEGTRSNFYAIRAGQGDSKPILQTAAEGILPGIARTIVLDVAPSLLQIDLSAPSLAERGNFTESFLTSASRGIVPIVRIDGSPVGAGAPGPVTQALTEAFDRRSAELEQALEPAMWHDRSHSR